ncbi:MAG: hypothetical protein JWQ53_3010 [Klenkia sp.]|nr:hypothetical protein [Klenkia sp.]
MPPLLERRGRLRVEPSALVVATLVAVLARTPSLLPRSWSSQAVVGGTGAAIGLESAASPQAPELVHRAGRAREVVG